MFSKPFTPPSSPFINSNCFHLKYKTVYVIFPVAKRKSFQIKAMQEFTQLSKLRKTLQFT